MQQAGKKAVFLDRDGIIIQERGDFNYKPEHIELVPGIAEGLKRLKAAGYVFAVITNQSGIGKGLYTHKRVKEIHGELTEFLRGFGIKILEWYYCPHHPSTSHCICRKPDSAMLEKAMARFGIEAASSWFVGDTERDILAGQKAGVKTLLVPANTNGEEWVKELLEREGAGN